MAFIDKKVYPLDTNYFYHLCAGKDWSMGTNKAVMGLTLNKATLSEIEIDLPPIDKQKNAASKLDFVDSLITARREQLAKLDELVKSRFVELFEDGESPIKSVEELCSAIVDCPHTTPKYEGELKNPAIRTAEIKKGYIEWETMRYVSDEEYEERTARLKPEAGDIVYGREGTFGNAAILPKGHNFCLGQRVMLLRPDYSKCTSEYLLYAVISDDVYRQALEKNNASTVAHVNVKDVKQFRIPLPSFDKQNQFAVFVEQTDKSNLAIQQSLDKLELLKKSLMQKYFG
jgi:type I restriction enzyme S subunit